MSGILTAQSAAEIDQLLEQLKTPGTRSSTAGGRLIFALDATASRAPTWDAACHIQGEMFEATAGLGGLEIQLGFYRGHSECKTSRWLTTASELHHAMRSVFTAGGHTQISRILDHTIRETQTHKIGALVFVGDQLEEKADQLCHLASELGRLGVPIFIFQEGTDRDAAAVFKQIAGLSYGAYLSFDLAAIGRLKELLGAIAVYVAGGHQALVDYGKQKGGEALRLTSQLRS
jgi:hypothetical protein